MEDIIDLIATDSPASEISDAIKGAIYAKSAEKIENLRPMVASSLFGGNDSESHDPSNEV